MIEIKPNALYTRDDLIALLAPLGLDADTFVARLAPRKVFRQVWYGRDLLKALDEAPALTPGPSSDGSTTIPAAQHGGGRRPRAGKSPSGMTRLESLARGTFNKSQ